MSICRSEMNSVSFRPCSLTLRDVSSSTLHGISFSFSRRAPLRLEVQRGREVRAACSGFIAFSAKVLHLQFQHSSHSQKVPLFLCIGIKICFPHHHVSHAHCKRSLENIQKSKLVGEHKLIILQPRAHGISMSYLRTVMIILYILCNPIFFT